MEIGTRAEGGTRINRKRSMQAQSAAQRLANSSAETAAESMQPWAQVQCGHGHRSTSSVAHGPGRTAIIYGKSVKRDLRSDMCIHPAGGGGGGGGGARTFELIRGLEADLQRAVKDLGRVDSALRLEVRDHVHVPVVDHGQLLPRPREHLLGDERCLHHKIRLSPCGASAPSPRCI